MDNWQLKQIKQCSKCPWLVTTNPHEIPNGYDVEKHQALVDTIAQPGQIPDLNSSHTIRIMACHESNENHCIGWLHNQLGDGNNIALRLQIRTCTNIDQIKLVGEQYPDFESTLPC